MEQNKDPQMISKHSSRLPIWVLSPREEQQARKNLKTETYKKCANFVQAMADCAKANGMKVFPTCDKQRDEMKSCLMFYQTDEKYLDGERDKIVLEKINKLEKLCQKQSSTK